VSTSQIPVEMTEGPALTESIEEWSRLSSRSFVPLTCTTTSAETFRGGMLTRAVGKINIAHLRFSPHVVERGPIFPGDAGTGRYKVGVQFEGRATVEQSGNRAHLGAGDMVLYDTSAPYRLEFPDTSRVLVLMFDHGALDLPPNAVAQLRAHRLGPEEPVHRMVSSFLSSMAENLQELTGMTGQRMGNSALDLLTTSLNRELDGQALVSSDEKNRLRAKVHDYIEAHLADPDLNPAMIAQAHYLSVRRLHQVFHDEGTTVSAWIRIRRLERCRRALEDPMSAQMPVARLAARWGFTDGAHFSRIFRAAYGVTPSQIRSQALSA
jgi:AraC-like DNA-binding protein